MLNKKITYVCAQQLTLSDAYKIEKDARSERFLQYNIQDECLGNIHFFFAMKGKYVISYK